MLSLLLVIIYITFISLGLPDSLLGSAWPVMQSDLNVPLSYAGIVIIIITVGTIISSLLSDQLTQRFKPGIVTAFSVSMTALALMGFSFSRSFIALCFWAIPYGLGAGAVDAALNNYVALNYASRHMNWLHCFWGLGATVSPYIMGYFLTNNLGWQNGYRAIGFIQIVLAVLLIVTLPIWQQKKELVLPPNDLVDGQSQKAQSWSELFQIKGLKLMLVTFFAYCGLELTTGLWATTYLVEYRLVPENVAAKFGSLFFIGITIGRFVCGFVADRFGDKALIRWGICLLASGIVFIALPLETDYLALCGLIIIGLGCAPIYPAIIHATPSYFGKKNSQAIIGIQMACAYLGSTIVPPVFGVLASSFTIGLFPAYLFLFAVLMFLTSERLNKLLKVN